MHPQERVFEEQQQVFGKDLGPVDYDGLKECQLLENCLKETLRLRPPIMTMMRMCKKPMVSGMTVVRLSEPLSLSLLQSASPKMFL